MKPTKADGKQTDTPIRFRPGAVRSDIHLIAETETGGNISEAIRVSIREKAERLRKTAA